jgi:CMP-N-acetylneuraminic acid synthetase
MKNIIALICARSGSKGIPKKNLLKFKETTLLGNSIIQAKKNKYIRRVFVSTDSSKIAKYAKKNGAEVPFIRPAYLAKDNSAEIHTWRHAIKFFQNKLKIKFDYIVSIPTTSPLRDIKDIDKSIKKAILNDCDIVFTISPSKNNPYFNMVHLKKNKLKIISDGKKKYFTRQQAPKCYDLTTVCYVFKPNYILKNLNLFSGKVGFVTIPSERAIDIDTKLDYKIACYLSN